MRLEIVLLCVLASPLVAEGPSPTPATPVTTTPAPELTPRQAYQQAETWFAQGHVFTPQEQTALDSLRTRLIDSGDADLASSLDLLRLGSNASASVADAKNKSAVPSNLEADTDAWNARERFVRDRAFWRGVRDGGLAVFTLSTITTLLLAATNDRNEALLHGGNFSDWQYRQDFSNGMNWALVGSASTMFLSLFPLLWGEARQ